MTLLQAINGKSAKELAELDEDKLKEYFGPLLNITRPELAPKLERGTLRLVNGKASMQRDLDLAKKELIKKMAAKAGMDPEMFNF